MGTRSWLASIEMLGAVCFSSMPRNSPTVRFLLLYRTCASQSFKKRKLCRMGSLLISLTTTSHRFVFPVASVCRNAWYFRKKSFAFSIFLLSIQSCESFLKLNTWMRCSFEIFDMLSASCRLICLVIIRIDLQVLIWTWKATWSLGDLCCAFAVYSIRISFVLVFKFWIVNLFEQLFRVMQSRSEIMLRQIGPKNTK